MNYADAKAYLDRQIALPRPDFSTYDPDWLKNYQRHVRRYMDCAPDGATFLVAPLQGWDGTPYSSRDPMRDQSPGYGEAMRRAYMRVGKHPLSGQRLFNPVVSF